jgi:CRP-like cAMP-binding protein
LADSVAQGHRDNRLLAAMSAEALALMGRDLREISLAQGAAIYEPGKAVEEIYFPQTGMISLLVVTKNGGMIETATVGREGAVGLHRGLGARRSFTRATTQIAGKFSVIHAPRFAEIVQGDESIRELISRYTEVLWAEAQQIAACNAAHDALSRLARWLLQTADRTASEKVPLTQEFLSQMLSVRRTTVTLLAQTIQKKGLIKYSRGHISILDRGGLEQLACECYHVIQHERLPHAIGITL